MAAAATPLASFVQPSRAELMLAARIVDSHPVVSAYASAEWDELSDAGKVWTAAIVREARRICSPSAQMIADVNAFLSIMADRYRRNTSRCFLGIRVNTMPRSAAMMMALATFEFATETAPFGDPAQAWDRDHAEELVDEDMHCWEAE